MLAGMDNHRLAPVRGFQGMIDRRDLHEIRPRSGDQVKSSGHCVFRHKGDRVWGYVRNG
jgi:hypothetical protein